MSIPNTFKPLCGAPGMRRVPYVRIAGPASSSTTNLLRRAYPYSSSDGYEAWAKIQIVENNADIKQNGYSMVAFGKYNWTPSGFVFYRGSGEYAVQMSHILFTQNPRYVGAHNMETYPGDVVELTYRLGTCVVRLGSRLLEEKTGLQWESPGGSGYFEVSRVGGVTYDFYGAKIKLDTGVSVEYVPVEVSKVPGIAVFENGNYVEHVIL